MGRGDLTREEWLMARRWLGVAAALFVSGTALASPITFDYQSLVTGATPAANPTLGAGGVYDGVGDLIVTTGSGNFRCTGSLLGSGMHILTAAHCVTNNVGVIDALSANISFFGDSGTYTIGVSGIFLDPVWGLSMGDLASGADIALLTLNAMAPIEIARYGLYTGFDEVGQTFTRIGYGIGGTGAGTSGGSGTKRLGMNEYDTAGTAFFGGISSNVLMYDFDNGNPANDAWGILGIPDAVGLGGLEAAAAPGDSGGPNFISGLIAAVTSFGFSYTYSGGAFCPVGTCSPDTVPGTNSSFGEIGGDTRVSSYAASIYSIINAPTPSTLALMLVAAPLLLRRRRSRGA